MTLKVTLVGAHAHEHAPAIALYKAGRGGRIGQKIAAVEDGRIVLPREMAGSVAFGPDVADPSQVDPRAFVTLRLSDHLKTWLEAGEIPLPAPWWRGWLGFQVCLSGTVSRCTPWFFDIATLRAGALGQRTLFSGYCQPLCSGVVEVWESTTCCWPLPIYEVPGMIKKLEQFLAVNPIMFPIPPLPDPGPVERELVARVDRAFAAGAVDTRFVPDNTLAQHLQTLRALPTTEAAAYVEATPALWRFWCNTSEGMLGETTLNPDGSFSYCYRQYPFFLFNCRHSYFYKVRQQVDGVWTTVYDGAAAHQYFTADQVAQLSTLTGIACVPPPQVPAGSITLSQIGATYAWDLNSHWNGPALGGTDLTQTGPMTMPIASTDTDVGLLLGTGAPWTGTLWFGLGIDEDLQAQGVVYYRLSTVQADLAGNPIGTPQPITNSIAWFWNDESTLPSVTRRQVLGPVTPAGSPNANLFQIPYMTDHPDGWIGVDGPAGRFHQYLDTTTLDNAIVGGPGKGNGRYMLLLEVFDAGGHRLVPSGVATSGSDVAGGFAFARLLSAPTIAVPEGYTTVVPQASLAHLFWVDNRPVNGHIGYFQSSAGTQTCQFIAAEPDTYFSVGYYAYHAVMCDNPAVSPVPSRSFMASYGLGWQEEPGGSTGTLDSGADLNKPASCPAGAAFASSPTGSPDGTTFATMLAGQTACAFAITLSVTPKHTNGFGTVGTSSWTAAVALSV